MKLESSYIYTQKMSRYRAFCFTLNNYTPEEVEQVKSWDARYLIFGKEVGESGTPHLQGYVYFAEAKTLSALKKKFSARAHWEVARGTPKQAAEYCEKDGDVFEKGERPKTSADGGNMERERWSGALEAVREGRYDDVPADILCKHLKSIEYAVNKIECGKRKVETLEPTTRHYWYWGEPGTGKSRRARQEAPQAYIKDPTQIWWDGYKAEEDVIIDDFDKFQVKQGGDMKRILDIYPFQAPVKGGYQLIRPQRIFITSNYRPEDIWDDQNTVDAIRRRVEVVHFSRFPERSEG